MCLPYVFRCKNLCQETVKYRCRRSDLPKDLIDACRDTVTRRGNVEYARAGLTNHENFNLHNDELGKSYGGLCRPSFDSPRALYRYTLSYSYITAATGVPDHSIHRWFTDIHVDIFSATTRMFCTRRSTRSRTGIRHRVLPPVSP